VKQVLKTIVIWIVTCEARLVLAKYRPRIIAVTGSVGKTSVKDAIYTALEPSLFIRKNEKTLNGEIGTPLTILGCESGWNDPLKWLGILLEGASLLILRNHYPKWLVLEVGADHPNEIRNVVRWLRPNVAVITALPAVPVHVEFFDSPEAVRREKRYLADALSPDGVLILGGDDKLTVALNGEYPAATVLYGFEAHNNVSASHVEIWYGKRGGPIGMKFDARFDNLIVPMQITGTIGKHQVYPILAAIAVSRALGVSTKEATALLREHVGAKGRMRVFEGHNDSTIIDDSYNSSPVALRAALSTLKNLKAKGKKIAVLGDMLELGRFSTEEHKKAGVQAANVVDVLLTVGVRARGLGEAARESGLAETAIQTYESDGAREAGKHLREILEPGDIVLIKGSQSIRLEKTVKEVMKERDGAHELLVRQEPEWLQRP
jgi:UDP-N-acetylmuramoyl-tripeptide--D-alanyl-D-alanine ligase